MTMQNGAAGSSGGGGFVARVNLGWPELVGLKQPAAIWRRMVGAEPFLAEFNEPLKRFGKLQLHKRIDHAMHEIAYARGAANRLSPAEAERLEDRLADALYFVAAITSSRSRAWTEPSFEADKVAVCDACWHLTPIETWRGFKGKTAGTALCEKHSPAKQTGDTGPLKFARRRMADRPSAPPPIDSPLNIPMTEFFALFAEGARLTDDVRWGAFLVQYFPFVACAYPDACSSVLSAFGALDAHDHPHERRCLHEALVDGVVEDRAEPSWRASVDADILKRWQPSETRHNWGAILLLNMLQRCERWLEIDKTIKRGGARLGAGRPRKQTVRVTAMVPNTAIAAGSGPDAVRSILDSKHA